jgi:hypothetical protein
VRRVVVRGGERDALSVQLAPLVGGAMVGLEGTPARPPTGEVTLDVRGRSPGLRLFLQPMATSGTAGAVGELELVCEAPCERTMRGGLFGAAIGRGEGEPALVQGQLELLGDSILDIEYRDESGTRSDGVIALAVTAGLTVAAIVLGSVMLDRGGDLYDSGWGVALLTTGIVVGALSLGGLGLVFAPDFGEVRVVPR